MICRKGKGIFALAGGGAECLRKITDKFRRAFKKMLETQSDIVAQTRIGHAQNSGGGKHHQAHHKGKFRRVFHIIRPPSRIAALIIHHSARQCKRCADFWLKSIFGGVIQRYTAQNNIL
jgi:mRNA-degrading endonuclease RelE of RelBE toxin-antitoxin system